MCPESNSKKNASPKFSFDIDLNGAVLVHVNSLRAIKQREETVIYEKTF